MFSNFCLLIHLAFDFRSSEFVIRLCSIVFVFLTLPLLSHVDRSSDFALAIDFGKLAVSKPIHLDSLSISKWSLALDRFPKLQHAPRPIRTIPTPLFLASYLHVGQSDAPRFRFIPLVVFTNADRRTVFSSRCDAEMFRHLATPRYRSCVGPK